MSSLVAPYYVKHGAFRLAAATAILLGLISVAINLWLVPSYQAIGAAAATAMTTLLGFGLVFSMLRILSGRWLWRIFRPDFRAEMAGFRQRRIPYSGPQ
jgi:O-antigen/teichoic acid export membrane protein